MLNKEALCGITNYMTPLNTIKHDFKLRYSDFIVNEIDPLGNVIPTQSSHYQPIKQPKAPIDTKPILINTEFSLKIDKLLGSTMLKEITEYIDKLNNGESPKDQPFKVNTELTKDQRTEFHKIIRECLPEFESTTENNEGKRLLIVLKSALSHNKRKKLNFAERTKIVLL